MRAFWTFKAQQVAAAQKARQEGRPWGYPDAEPEPRVTERVVEKAVERMLPRGPLLRQILGNLRVYKGAAHPHEAQQPQALDVGSLNRKNVSA